ncbi:MAG TPA: Uma2 family endonuclease [Chloroflexota bacterium]|nr:Uma2 family endonuclease [Chloroflexota bacterium]
MAVERKLMTAEELLRLPDDGLGHELVRGELRTMPPTSWEHGGATSVFDASLGHYVRTHQLGQVVTGEPGFLLTTNPDTVRAPDVAFVRRERLLAAGPVRGYWPGPPDLVVEVISPHDLYTEVDEKVAEWLEQGARLVFVVNPRRRAVAIHRPGQPVRILTGDDVLDGEDVIPGWTLPIRDLFSSGQP